MCCRRRRHQPVVVTLGVAAYNAYQTRQLKRAEEQRGLAPSPVDEAKPEQTLDNAMRALNLEKQSDDIPPPDYEDVVVHRTMVDDQGRDVFVDDRDFARDVEKEVFWSDDTASLRDFDGQLTAPQPCRAPTWKEMKGAWKAEKRRAKAERKARKAEMWEEWRARKEARLGGRRCC